MKKIIFLIIASLLVIGLVLPGCGGGGGGGNPQIIIGIPYPMNDIQGTSMLAGAQMAAEEINAAGGVNVTVGANSTIYDIAILGRNDNEISAPTNAYQAVTWLINNDAQFIIGGFRTEAVEPMIQGVLKTASPSVPFFICGSSTGQLLSGGLSGTSKYPDGYGTPYAYGYNASSNFYDYIFRVTPFNSGFLLGMVMPMFIQICEQIQTALNWTWNFTGTGTWPNKVNVAIFGENLIWAAPIIGGYQALVGNYGPYFGWNLTTTQLCSDDPLPSVVDSALATIEAAHTQVILTCMSGPVGKTFGKRMGALNITAIPVGINVEAQGPDYWTSTSGGARYEVTTGTWAAGMNNTVQTAGFLARYAAFTGGSFPIYTAASYDMVYSLKEAIEAVDSLDKDAVCTYILGNSRTTTSGIAQYFPKWDQNTTKAKSGVVYPALNATQVDALYAVSGYSATYNYTMYPFTTNDIVFGPTYVTGIGVQWVSGAKVGMWPKAGYDVVVNPTFPYRAETFMTRALCGLNWSNTLEYPGVQNAVIPADYQAQWLIWLP